MEANQFSQFIRFLREEMALSATELHLVLRQPEQMPNLIAMMLWQYGLVTLNQLNQIFDWLEQSAAG